jgi:hypothetical protein
MNIGLLMTYNDRDIIEEMMESNREHVDTIFALSTVPTTAPTGCWRATPTWSCSSGISR